MPSAFADEFEKQARCGPARDKMRAVHARQLDCMRRMGAAFQVYDAEGFTKAIIEFHATGDEMREALADYEASVLDEFRIDSNLSIDAERTIRELQARNAELLAEVTDMHARLEGYRATEELAESMQPTVVPVWVALVGSLVFGWLLVQWYL